LRILSKNLKKGYIELIPENENDLWVLYNVIEPGDVVVGHTTRDVRIGESGKSKRIPLTLALRVTNLEFQPFTERLRIHGIVVEGPERYGIKGKHHTININLGDKLVIWKDKWYVHQLRKLESTSIPREKVVVVTLDYDEVCIAQISEQGVQVLLEESSRLPGKRDPEKFSITLKKYIEKIVKTLIDIIEKYGIKIVVAASPGGLAREIVSRLKSLKNLTIISDTVSIGGCSGLSEVLRRDSIKEAIRKLSIIRAHEYLELFRRLLVRNPELVAYGLEEVEYAVKSNAVEKLLVSSSYIRTYDDELRRRVNDLIDEAYRRRAEVIVVPESSDVCIEVNGLGGLVAILRFPLYKASGSV